MSRLNFHKSVQMHLACASDDFRPVFDHVYFEDGFAYATDGHILVKNNLEECTNLNESQLEHLNKKFLHKDSYKAMLKYDFIEISEDGIECKKGGEKAFLYFNNEDLKYVNANGLLEVAINQPNLSTSQIGFRLKDIERINKALYDADKCKFRFKGNDYHIYVLLESDNRSIGMIMPLSKD